MFFYQCVHSSESILGVRGNFTAFTLRVYTHFFQKLAMIGEFSFQSKVGNHLFQKHVGSLSSIFLLFLLTCSLFPPFFMFLCFLWTFCIFYLFVVDKGVSLAPTYPQLRLGNKTYVVLSELNFSKAYTIASNSFTVVA